MVELILPHQKEEFLSALKELHSQTEPEDVYQNLVYRYQERHRRYHTLEHIATCLDELKSIAFLVENPSALTTAIWFHDAIFHTNPVMYGDNEAMSANLARTMLCGTAEPNKDVQRALRFVLCTSDEFAPENHDEKLMRDIDRVILGKPEHQYFRYAHDVKREFDEYVPTSEWRVKRVDFLQKLLKKPLFQTDFFNDMYGVQAKRNIKEEIKFIIDKYK